MHKIKSTYTYNNPVPAQVPMDDCSSIGAAANLAEIPLVLFKGDGYILQNNFPLIFFINNIKQHQHAADETAVQLTNKLTAQQKNQFNYS